MRKSRFTDEQMVSKRRLGAVMAGAVLAVAAGPAAAQNFGPPELIEAAKK